MTTGPDGGLPGHDAGHDGAPTCSVGAACDDGDACTTGETFAADCTCGGGATLDCTDNNPCTADSCHAGSCSSATLPDGMTCGTGMTCEGGVCSVPTCPPPTGTPPSVTLGTTTAILLRGTVVTPTTAFAGEVLVQGDTITCVAPTCAGAPGATGASIVETHGLIFPGLIDTHNHVLFDIFDEDDWSPTMSYMNHNQWTNEARYGAMVDCKQYLNGEGTTPDDWGCEMDKYGELKALVAGTTSIVGAANPANKSCYGSIARTIDQTPNDLGMDKVQVATLFPTTAAADGVCANFTDGGTTAYLIHIGEGVDTTALNEFGKLGTITTTDNCLYAPQTTIVHGAALGDAELTRMATAGMSLVWSPKSNVFLYGGGTDLSQTANIPLARAKGLNIALAPDWSIGGSHNLLDELRFADHVDNTLWGDILTAKDLVAMVTVNAARALGLGAVLGSVEVGKKADLMVITGDAADPWTALLSARPRDVQLVLVGGVPLYGDAVLEPVAPAAPGCEHLDVCCREKFVCVAEAGGTSTNKLGQTYTEIATILATAIADYDSLQLTSFTIAPVTPLFDCE
jgi:cytosine/adenosine deaminase-related metal-dependent hydrolase